MTHNNKRNTRLLLTAISCLLSCVVALSGAFDSWQEKIYDRLFTKRVVEAPIIVIAIDDLTLDEIGPWPLERARYADILSYLGEAKAIGIDVFFAEASRYGVADDKIFQSALNGIKIPVTLPTEVRDRGGIAVKNIPQFLMYTTEASANIPLDQDGIARFHKSVEGTKTFAESVIGADHSYLPFRIHYIGPEKTILTIPFVDVLSGKVPPNVFKDKFVFIGATAKSLHDSLLTPFGDMSGVEVHAQIAHTILTDSFLVYVSLTIVLGGIVMIHLAVLCAVFWLRSGSLIALSIVLMLIVSQVLAIVSFGQGLLVSNLYLLFAFLFVAALLLISEYAIESRDRRFIEKTFRYYLTPDVIEDLKNNPLKLKLGGENRTVTIFFSDIRGFTTISEKLSVEKLTRVINEYFTAMTDIIMEHGGLVDKYIGDAIMAFWGAPINNAHQAQDAAHAVRAMSLKLKELNKGWREWDIPEINIGIGLNKGQVIVGNMGSEKRFNYTIMGDEVNFGSRLEGLTKKYAVECLISESVADELKQEKDILIREIDCVTVKGKKEPKKIYQLITECVDQNKKKAVAFFGLGLEAYKKGEWNKAADYFGQGSKMEDKPSKIFVERIQELKENPPENWKGIYEHTSK